jgi:hypothetical protein
MVLIYCSEEWAVNIVLRIQIETVKVKKVKSKVVPLFLTEHRAMKVYWGSGGIAPLIL